MATRVIVVGNEKGGCGKSTTALHIALGLLQAGRRVATLDVDTRQQTMTRFLANRADYLDGRELTLSIPDHRLLAPGRSDDAGEDEAARADRRITEALDSFSDVDAVVIDTPGSDTALSRAAHGRADVLVTPINDSFVDLDVLAAVDPETFAVLRPSRYAELVWEHKKRRASNGGSIDWIVMRNRLSSLDAHNKRRVDAALKALGPRVGFRLLPGLAERVIYRELFPRGLTVLDLGAAGIPMTMSHVAARSEIRTVIGAVLARAPDAGAGHRAPQAEPVLAAPGSRPSGANL